MITAVDTSILLDIFGAQAPDGPAAQASMREALRHGRVLASDPVWAETASFFPDSRAASQAFERLGVEYDPLSHQAALLAGRTWREYRRRGGRRTRIATDFLIGAHGREQADRLLTRDRGFYRTYFAGLRIVEPSA